MFEGILNKMRPAAARLPTPSRLDIVRARIPLIERELIEIELSVRAALRDPKDLISKRYELDDLKGELTTLEQSDVDRQRIRTLQEKELPAEETALQAAEQEFANDLLALRRKARALIQRRDQIQDRFADYDKYRTRGQIHVPVTNANVLSLIGVFRFLEDLVDEQATATHWLGEAREAGLTVPHDIPSRPAEPARRHAPLETTVTDDEQRIRAIRSRRQGAAA